MAGLRIDAVARALALTGSRRGAIAAIALAAVGPLGETRVEAKKAFPRDCKRFVIAGGPKKNRKLDDVDDDLLIEIRRRRSTRFETIYRDQNQCPNGPGCEPTKPIEFKARVGDELRITATNSVRGGCRLDSLYLFCKNGKGNGQKLTDKLECSQQGGETLGDFFREVIEIEA